MSDETLQGRIDSAKSALGETLEHGENDLRRYGVTDSVSDTIHDEADMAVPGNTAARVAVFGSASSLWYAEPEGGYRGCNDITDAIGRVIYDAVQAALYEYANGLDGDDIMCEAQGCEEKDDHIDTDYGMCIEHCAGLPHACEECKDAEEGD